MNFNVFLLAQKVQPRLAVLDGLEGMEGNGPNHGTLVDHRVALASTDFIAADTVACQLMGVDRGDVGYLTYCSNAGIGQGDLSRIKIIGSGNMIECSPENQQACKFKLSFTGKSF